MTPLSTDMAGNVSFLRCTLIRWLILSQQLVRYVVKPLPGKDRDMDVFAFTLCTELWGTAKASEKFAFSSLGRGGGGSWKPLPDFKLGGSWRSRWQPSSGSLRSWCTRCMICSSERSWDLGSPWLYGALLGAYFMVRVCLPLWNINAGIFSHQSSEITQWVGGGLSEGTAPCVAWCIHGRKLQEPSVLPTWSGIPNFFLGNVRFFSISILLPDHKNVSELSHS